MSSCDGESVSPLDNQGEGLTIAETASQLGVSQKTVRRWIKAGRLPATREEGPYGPQYRVSTHAVQTAQQIIDVVKVERPTDPQTLALAVSRAIEERQMALITEVVRIRDGLLGEMAILQQQVSALNEELARTREQLERSEQKRRRLEDHRELAAQRRAERIDQQLTAMRQELKDRATEARPWRPWWKFW